MNNQFESEAGELLVYALDRRLAGKPESDGNYARLLKLYRENGEFRQICTNFFHGIGLQVRASSDRTGLVFSSTDGSLFAPTTDDFKGNMRSEERMIYGLIMLAVVSYLYSSAEYLEDDSDREPPPFSEDQVKNYLLSYCRQITAAAHEPENEESLSRELVSSAGIILEQPESDMTEKKNESQSSIRGRVRYVLMKFEEYGYIRRDPVRGEHHFIARPLLRVRVQDLAGLPLNNFVEIRETFARRNI